MTPKRYQISTTVSPATWYQIVRLTVDYGTKREVITRAVNLLEAEHERNTRTAMFLCPDCGQHVEGRHAAYHDEAWHSLGCSKTATPIEIGAVL